MSKEQAPAIALISALFVAAVVSGCDPGDRQEIAAMKDSLKVYRARIHELDSLVKTVKGKLWLHTVQASAGVVDLTVSSAQELEEGFALIDASMVQHLSGVKISGGILNTTSLHYPDVEFEILIGTESKKFTVFNVRPGNARRFQVYIPNVDAQALQFCSLNYVRSNISYGTD